MEWQTVFTADCAGYRKIGDDMIKMKKRVFATIIICVIFASMAASALGFYVFTGATDMKLMKVKDYETMEDMASRYGKLYKMQNTVNEQFLWKTDKNAQMDAMYRALLDSLGDEYSVYMNEEDYKEWEEYVTGTFTGVGITFLQTEDGDFEVKKILEGGPADLAGVKVGDLLLKVDGKTFRNSDDMAEALRGETGTRVKVTYAREGKEKTVSVVRGQVEETSIYAGTIDGKYGYIHIRAFESNTAEQFRTELAAFENKDVKGLIIDLRHNPGGIVDQSLEIADMLLPECTMIHTEDSQGKKEYYNSDPKCTKLKYVLLVDENTASASEILAAAVKENQGGKLVGMKTYGKGIIQSSMTFGDGTAMRLTTMQYLSPKNHKIHKVGVEPDYQVKLSAKSKTDKQLEKAIELLK